MGWLHQVKAGTGSPSTKRHMGRVAALGCIACSMFGHGEDTPAQVHHIREGRQARSDFLTLPLCYEHHQGDNGVHKAHESLMRRLGVSSEFDLLAIVLQRIEQTRLR